MFTDLPQPQAGLVATKYSILLFHVFSHCK